jgi:hypothetical protein
MAKLKAKELSSTLATFFLLLFVTSRVLPLTGHICNKFLLAYSGVCWQLVFVRRAGQWRHSAITPTTIGIGFYCNTVQCLFIDFCISEYFCLNNNPSALIFGVLMAELPPTRERGAIWVWPSPSEPPGSLLIKIQSSRMGSGLYYLVRTARLIVRSHTSGFAIRGVMRPDPPQSPSSHTYNCSTCHAARRWSVTTEYGLPQGEREEGSKKLPKGKESCAGYNRCGIVSER